METEIFHLFVIYFDVMSNSSFYWKFLNFPMCAIACAHLIFPHLIMLITFCEEYELCSSLFMQFSPGPSILLRSTWSCTLNLCSFFNVGDQDLHTYRTTNKISLVYFHLCIFR
jgi:hypothetical protein